MWLSDHSVSWFGIAMPASDRTIMNSAVARSSGQSFLRYGHVIGRNMMQESVQRMKDSCIGGMCPAEARMITMLPAQHSMQSTSNR